MKYKKWLLGFVVVLIIIAGGAWYYISYYSYQAPLPFLPSSPNQFLSDMAKGNSLFALMSPDSTIYYMRALGEATNADDKLVAQYSIGFSYAISDLYKMVDALKAIAQNTQNPLSYRAAAVNTILRAAFNKDPALDDYIFRGPDWGTLADQYTKSFAYTSSTTPKSLVYLNAIKNGYEWSLTITPSLEAYYTLANWYAQSAFAALPLPLRTAAINQAEQYMQKGDDLENNSDPIFPLKVSELTYLLQRNFADVDLYYLGANTDAQSIERNLTNFIAESTASSDANRMFNVDASSYALAAVLAFSHHPSTDVHAALEPLFNHSLDPGFAVFISKPTAESKGSLASYKNPLIITVAKADPKFEQLLLTLGWNASDFK